MFNHSQRTAKMLTSITLMRSLLSIQIWLFALTFLPIKPTGKQAWLKMEKKGRLHGRVNHMGAATPRCTCSHPNLGQVPRVSAKYGTEYRSFFKAAEGYSLLGADASGLELHCLAHYMAACDGGDYANVVLEGDVRLVM